MEVWDWEVAPRFLIASYYHAFFATISFRLLRCGPLKKVRGIGVQISKLKVWQDKGGKKTKTVSKYKRLLMISSLNGEGVYFIIIIPALLARAFNPFSCKVAAV